MKKLGPWLIVIVLAAVVVAYRMKYVRPEAAPGGGVVAVGQKPDEKEIEPPREEPKQAPPKKEIEEPRPPDPGAAELFIKAAEAEKQGDARAVDLYREVVRNALGSEEATQAAAALGNIYYKQKQAARAVQYLKIALAGKLAAQQRRTLRQKLDELSAGLIFDPQNNRRASYHVVKPGDTLSVIGQKYQIPWELLQRLNRLEGTSIRVDQRLKVVQGPFDAVIEKSKFKLSVYLGNKYVKSYDVGLGKEDSTPVGSFKVISKLKKPDWYRPGKVLKYGDPENALGTRWIGFMKGYGIHGTWEPETVGSQSSEGCVRMLNKDVEELFDLLIKGKSKITIRK
ncbi:MAG: L,D-transpeptidase family protein [Planctomycetes bacterium]|nr:L,D-transpeptidase family protein [Planctomycetota bacterium]